MPEKTSPPGSEFRPVLNRALLAALLVFCCGLGQASASESVTREEVLSWVADWQKAMNTGDGAVLQSRFDLDLFVDQALEGSGASPKEKTRFKERLQSELEPNLYYFFRRFAGSKTKCLDVVISKDTARARLRSLDFVGDLKYSDLCIRKNSSGKLVVTDVYVVSQGTTASRLYTLIRIAQADPLLSQFLVDAENNDHEKVVSAYEKLSTESRSRKPILLAHARSLLILERPLDTAFVDRFQQLYPEDPGLHLLQLNRAWQARDYATFHQHLTLLSQRLPSSDPYLKAFQGLAYLKEGRPEEALKSARAASDLEPDLEEALWLRVSAGLALKNYRETAVALDRLAELSEASVSDVFWQPEYADFRESAEGKAWMESWSKPGAP